MSETKRERFADSLGLLPLHPQHRSSLLQLWNDADMETHANLIEDLDAARAELAALRTERDTLRATVAGLRESLEVFVPQHFRDRGGDDMTGYYLEGKVVRLGDIRRAFAALAAAPPAPDGRDSQDYSQDGAP